MSIIRGIRSHCLSRNSKREIGQIVLLKKPPEKKSAYFIIVPNNETDNKKEENKVFWLRLFASEPVSLSYRRFH